MTTALPLSKGVIIMLLFLEKSLYATLCLIGKAKSSVLILIIIASG